MPGRKYTAGSGYRYGFNGKENDNDAGKGIQDYGMRIYDTRLGKFLSVDPISYKYPELTPYQSASNRPIDGIDLDGLEYLSVTVSKISMNISVIESDGKIGIASDIFISPDKNISGPTYNYLMNNNSGHIATLQTTNYNEIQTQIEEKLQAALEKLEMKGVLDMPKSLTQKEIYVQKQIKSSRIMRKTNPNASTVNVPTSVRTGSAKGSAILTLIEYGGKAVVLFQKWRVRNDFEDANGQIYAVQSVLNYINIGLNNKVFKDNAGKDNLYDYANYLLDGTKPMHMVTVGHNVETGTEIREYQVDYYKIYKFYLYSKKIDKIQSDKTAVSE